MVNIDLSVLDLYVIELALNHTLKSDLVLPESVKKAMENFQNQIEIFLDSEEMINE